MLNTLNFHITNRCNLSCRHCLYSAGEKELDELSFCDVKKILDEFSALVKSEGRLNLFGGEPLIREDIFEIISYASCKEIRVGITTNANFSQDIIEKLSNSGISRVTIDLDGASSDTHDWLRCKKGHFESNLAKIRLLVSRGVSTSVTSVLHRGNGQEVEHILKLCTQLCVSSLSFFLFTPFGRGREMNDLMFSGSEWIDIKKRILLWIDANNPKFDIIWEKSYDVLPPNSRNFFSYCDGKPKEALDLRSDGNVYYCGLLSSLENSPVLGNLKNESLVDVMQKVQECGLDNKIGCAALALNAGGCIEAPLYDPRGTQNGISPICPYDWMFLNQSKKL